MGRKKVSISYIDDEKERKTTFKKRRLGLLKKAMQLSIMCDTLVQVKVYNPDDFSLLEYNSEKAHIAGHEDKYTDDVHEYVGFSNENYQDLEELDMKISKSGHAGHEDEDTIRIFEQLDGFNMRSFFSLNNKDKIQAK